MSTTVIEPELDEELLLSLEDAFEDLYTVVIYNDDVNTFDYVASVLAKCFGITYDAAFLLATVIHNEGKCVYGAFSKEEAADKAEYCRQKRLNASIAPV